MRFGEVPTVEAEGAILAHSVPLGRGRLRKGALIGPRELARLTEAGVASVWIARPDGDEVHEDAAAGRLADAIGGAGLRVGPAGTGRVNLYAEGPGLCAVDAARIGALNAIDPGITVATVAPWQRMAEGAMVATVKIIPYAVGAEALGMAVREGAGALSLHGPVMGEVGFVQTVLAGDDGAKGHEATEARLGTLGIALGAKTVVPHEIGALANALAARREPMVLILTASATSDVRDVGPAGLVAAGGHLDRFGIPVDPGNLLFYGSLNGRPVVGLPGCARAPAPNGADWIIDRLACGVGVTPRDIAGMGVGGLLKEAPSRPHSRMRGAGKKPGPKDRA